ncbi:MAG TPA: ribbon-helix-helix domain-containing protein [Candidatus Obscuribacterales bacterium]
MNNKKQIRKPLSDALAQDFVYGENSAPAVTPKLETIELETIELSETKTQPQPTPQPETTFMDRLQVQPKEGTKRFTVDLPESTHRKLSMLAARTGRTKAEIVRLLLDEALENVQD